MNNPPKWCTQKEVVAKELYWYFHPEANQPPHIVGLSCTGAWCAFVDGYLYKLVCPSMVGEFFGPLKPPERQK